MMIIIMRCFGLFLNLSCEPVLNLKSETAKIKRLRKHEIPCGIASAAAVWKWALVSLRSNDAWHDMPFCANVGKLLAKQDCTASKHIITLGWSSLNKRSGGNCCAGSSMKRNGASQIGPTSRKGCQTHKVASNLMVRNVHVLNWNMHPASLFIVQFYQNTRAAPSVSGIALS